MPNLGQRRGPTLYWVYPAGSTSEPFRVELRHSRERDVLEALINAGAAGASFYDLPAPRWASAIHRLRNRGVDIITERVRFDIYSCSEPGRRRLTPEDAGQIKKNRGLRCLHRVFSTVARCHAVSREKALQGALKAG